MKIIEIAEANVTLAKYASELAEEPIVITSNGKPIAALMSLENVDFETISLSSNQNFIDLIERSRKHHRAEGGISSEEMRRKLGLS